MTKSLLTVAAAVLLTACATSTPEATTTAATAAPAGDPVVADATEATQTADAGADEGEEKLVCRKEMQTGSRFKRTVCFKQSTLDGRSEVDQAALRQMRSIRSGGSLDMTNGRN